MRANGGKRAKALRSYRDGMSVEEIARRLDVPAVYVEEWVEEEFNG